MIKLILKMIPLKTYAMRLDLFTKIPELRDQNILFNTVLQINVAPRLKVQVQY